MRALTRGRSADDDRGAVAVLVALVTSLVLIAVTAFVTDFGMAYVHKRELQTAADAAALSAAQVFEKQLTTGCSTSNMAPVEALRGAAETSADTYLAANVDGDVAGEILPGSAGLHCKGAGVEVVYEAHGTTPTFFGPGDSIATSRSAAAAYDRNRYGKLRPWGLCSSVVNATGQVTFVGLKGAELKDASAGCGGPTAEPPGGWYVMECTDSGGSTGDTATNVSTGCTTDISPVPSQTLHNATPSQLWSYLTTYCPKKAKNTTCLASDSGYNVKNFRTEWQALVGQTIEMPVMCYPPQCQSLAVAGSGSTASYAVHKIAVVEICGFGLHGAYSTAASWPTDDCTAKNPKGYKASDIASGGAGFFLIFRGVYGADSGDTPLATNSHLRLTQ